MKVIVAEHFGVCFGVRDAIDQAHALAREAPLTILGELVHNPIVREQLRAQGVQEQSSADAANGRVMITAHGTSDKQREALSKRGLEVADGTCPLVRYAHDQLKRLVRAGYFPIVITSRSAVWLGILRMPASSTKSRTSESFLRGVVTELFRQQRNQSIGCARWLR